jgi:hypothetical protein
MNSHNSTAELMAGAMLKAKRMSIGILLYVFIYSANVTGQRTRHLVAGTLDPIVGDSFVFHPVPS